jgi:hypothetical protein
MRITTGFWYNKTMDEIILHTQADSHYMTLLHGNSIPNSWQKMSLEAQLGNIGSEYERALRWKEKNQPQMFEKAASRMLELSDLTLADSCWHGSRLKELARAREVSCAELYGDKELSGNPEGLKKYFLLFATFARNKK